MILLAQLPAFEDLIRNHDCPYTLATGIVIFQALVFGSITAYLAVHRCLSVGRWFAVGFFASFVGLLWVRTQAAVAGRFEPRRFGKTPTTYAPIRCDECGISCHPCCEWCPRCGRPLGGEHPVSEVELAQRRDGED